MRLPFTRIYRAFPELDQFPDAPCEGYVLEARRQHARLIGAWSAGGYLLMMLGFGLTFAATAAVDESLQASARTRQAAFSLWGLALIILPGGVVSGCLALVCRDAGLRRAIAKRLKGARCAGCSYSLLGLAVAGGRVTCPECGRVEDLADRSLSPADILAVEQPSAPG